MILVLILNHNDQKSIISVRNLYFRYYTRNKLTLENINLDIKKGEFVLLVGASGSGKTTLLRTINGLIPHFYGGFLEGTIIVNGLNPIKTPTREMAKYVGIIFQNPDNQLFMNNVEQEIAFGLENFNFPSDLMEQRINEIIKNYNLENIIHKQISELSGGEKQKVAITAILVLQPEIIIMDEPTSELDPKSTELILSMILHLNKNLGKTIIIAEHRIEKIFPYVDRIVILEDGKVIVNENIRDFFSKKLYLNIMKFKVPFYIQVLETFREKNFEILNQMDNFPLEFNLVLNVLNLIFEKLFNKLKENGKNPIELINIFLKNDENNNQTVTEQNSCLVEINNLLFYYNSNTKLRNKRTKKKNSINNNSLNDEVFESKDIESINQNKLGIIQNKFFLKIENKNFYGGTIVGIIGPNGSGKTTFLKLLNGLLKPIRGDILICGESTKNKTVASLSSKVGLMFQNPNIQFFRDTLYDEFYAILFNYATELNEIKPKIYQLMDYFDILKYKEEYPRYLSQGELQRSSMVSVLLSTPKILALDEPTHGMDAYQKKFLFDFLNEYKAKGNLVFVVSHDIETLINYADRILFFEQGCIKFDGSPSYVLPQLEIHIDKLKNENQYFNQQDSTYFISQSQKLIKSIPILNNLFLNKPKIVSSKKFIEFVKFLLSHLNEN